MVIVDLGAGPPSLPSALGRRILLGWRCHVELGLILFGVRFVMVGKEMDEKSERKMEREKKKKAGRKEESS